MRHLTDKDRYYIQIQLKAGVKVCDIAKALGFSRVSIYAEIKRGTVKQLNSDLTEKHVYLWDTGSCIAKSNQAYRNNKKLSPDHPYLVELCKLIKKYKYSIYAAMQKINKPAPVCETTIYNYICFGYLPYISVYDLPYAKPKRKKKVNAGKRQPFERGRSIDDRPALFGSRSVYGHWEMDTVYSSKDDLHCLLVLSERKTREEIVIKIKDRTCPSVIRALDNLERKIGTPAFRSKFLSITCDNGMEFSNWRRIEKSVRTKSNRTVVYFCHPYRSGERGTNENTNKMIRRWIPKGDDIGLYKPSEILQIQEWINNYPRRIFKGKSAHEFLLSCADV